MDGTQALLRRAGAAVMATGVFTFGFAFLGAPAGMADTANGNGNSAEVAAAAATTSSTEATTTTAKIGGNNGTVKVHGDTVDGNENQPHIPCSFLIVWNGFDQGLSPTATVTFTLQGGKDNGDPVNSTPPGSDVVTLHDGAGSQGYTLSFADNTVDHHVDITVNTKFSNGTSDVKHKVYWVDACAAETTTTTAAPTTTTTAAPTTTTSSSVPNRETTTTAVTVPSGGGGGFTFVTTTTVPPTTAPPATVAPTTTTAPAVVLGTVVTRPAPTPTTAAPKVTTTKAPTVVAARTLARTGVSTRPLVLMALVLVLAGVALFALGSLPLESKRS